MGWDKFGTLGEKGFAKRCITIIIASHLDPVLPCVLGDIPDSPLASARILAFPRPCLVVLPRFERPAREKGAACEMRRGSLATQHTCQSGQRE